MGEVPAFAAGLDDGDGLLAMLMPTMSAAGEAGEAVASSAPSSAQPESPSRQSLDLAAMAAPTDMGSSASMDLSAMFGGSASFAPSVSAGSVGGAGPGPGLGDDLFSMAQPSAPKAAGKTPEHLDFNALLKQGQSSTSASYARRNADAGTGAQALGPAAQAILAELPDLSFMLSTMLTV